MPRRLITGRIGLSLQTSITVVVIITVVNDAPCALTAESSLSYVQGRGDIPSDAGDSMRHASGGSSIYPELDVILEHTAELGIPRGIVGAPVNHWPRMIRQHSDVASDQTLRSRSTITYEPPGSTYVDSEHTVRSMPQDDLDDLVDTTRRQTRRTTLRLLDRHDDASRRVMGDFAERTRGHGCFSKLPNVEFLHISFV